jgi:hypothetical protein
VLATVRSFREVGQTWSFRGSKSRNKVTVGEPAVGSLKSIQERSRSGMGAFVVTVEISDTGQVALAVVADEKATLDAGLFGLAMLEPC